MTVKELIDVSAVSDGAKSLAAEESTPATYLASLEQQELYQDAIRFLAHKLAIDAGVKWAVAAVRELQAPDPNGQKDETLDAADRWTKTPGDPARRATKETADKAATRGPGYLVAMAVFMSGGSIASPEAPETPPPPYAAQKFVAGSIQIAVVSQKPQEAKDRYQRALTMGKALDTVK